jgi:hypothetical protein
VSDDAPRWKIPIFTYFVEPREVCPNCGGAFRCIMWCNTTDCAHVFYPDGYDGNLKWGPQTMRDHPHEAKECATCYYRWWERGKP